MESAEYIITRIEEILDKKLDEKLDKKLDKRFEDFEKRMNEKFEKFQKEMTDKMCLWENDYGMKINAIYDSVSLEMQKNIEKSERIRNLEKRTDRVEVNLFSYEKRISNLEMNL